MIIELTLTPPVTGPNGDTYRRTTWAIRSKGQTLAASTKAYRHRADAIRAVETITRGRVGYEPIPPTGTRSRPICLFYDDGTIVPIDEARP